MKKFLLSLSLIAGIIPISLSFTSAKLESAKLESLKAEKVENSILSYDSSLGIFKDHTKQEVKSYYSSLSSKTGLHGDQFLSELQKVISNGHTKVSNGDAWNSDWRLFTLLDRDYELDPLSDTEISTQVWKKDKVKVIPLYTDKTTFDSSNKNFDREHMWPKSRGFKFIESNKEDGKEKPYAATDMHNLRCAESTNNQVGHNNYPYGNVKDKNAASTTKVKSKYTDQVTGYRGFDENGVEVYEPRDEDKGDIARGLFYMAARYHNYVDANTLQPALKLVDFTKNDKPTDTINCITTKNAPATYGNLSTLLKWHVQDPVNEYEIHRNNLVYNAVQHNRNPFVDYPSWATVAFGNNLYLDLSKEDGSTLSSSFITVNETKTDFATGDTLDLKNIKLTYTKLNGEVKEIEVSSSAVKVYLIENGTETLIKDGYKFTKEGTFDIKFTFMDFETNETFETTLTVTITTKSLADKVMAVYERNKAVFLIIAGATIIIVVVLSAVFKSKKTKKKTKNNKTKTTNKKKNK